MGEDTISILELEKGQLEPLHYGFSMGMAFN